MYTLTIRSDPIKNSQNRLIRLSLGVLRFAQKAGNTRGQAYLVGAWRRA
jgi:hypothetical protein